MYDWLPDYDAFTANFLLQLTKTMIIKRGNPDVDPVLKQILTRAPDLLDGL